MIVQRYRQMQCPKHPDLPARFKCEKFEVRMCERCMECRSPELYCKFRQHCVIWELLEEERKSGSPEEESDERAR